MSEEAKEKEKEQSKDKEIQVRIKRRGLAAASKETRKRVAESGGNAPHKKGKRGLQAVKDPVKLHEIASAGGKARACDKVGLTAAGRKGGRRVKELYGGSGHYEKIGSRGGNQTKQTLGKEHYRTIGIKGGAALMKIYGVDFYREIARLRKQKKGKRK